MLTKFNGNAEEVAIPKGVKVIGKKAFFGNKTIRKVTLPDSVKEIGTSAFQDCFNLEQVVIGAGSKLNKIGWAAFKNDTKLDTSFADNVKTVVGNAFEGIEEETEPVEEEQQEAVAEEVEEEPEAVAEEIEEEPEVAAEEIEKEPEAVAEE